MYKADGSGKQGDDVYFTASKDGANYTFVIESYLTDSSTDVYKAAESLEIGKTYNVKVKTRTQASQTNAAIYLNTNPSSTKVFDCTNAELYTGVEFKCTIPNAEYYNQNHPLFGVRTYESGISFDIEVTWYKKETIKEDVNSLKEDVSSI
jgi:hypothetical protein